jgi:hypothetical protein
MKCPTLNELADYTHGLLDEGKSAVVKTHVTTGCSNCLENLRWIEEVALLAREDRSFAFPEETIKGLVAWFKTQPAHTPPSFKNRMGRKLVAKLIFDSFSPDQLAPVRNEPGAGHSMIPAAKRQMLFQTERYDIDLRFEAIEDDPTEDLIGQILPQNEVEAIPAGATVQLWHDEKEQMSTKTDSHGFFRFARIPSRNYGLKIQIAEVEINILDLSTVRPA